MDSKNDHKACEVVNDNESSTSKDKDTVHNAEGITFKETNNISKDNEAGTSKTKMKIETMKAIGEIEIENDSMQQFAETYLRKMRDNIPTFLNDTGSSSSSSSQNKVKRNISKGQINSNTGILMEKSDNSSDEDSNKRQKLNESTSNILKSESENRDNAPKFHKIKSKVEKRNYRSKKSSTGENGESCSEGHSEDVEMRQEIEEAAASTRTESHEQEVETSSDGSDVENAESDLSEWTTSSEEVSFACLTKEKPKPNWFMVPELVRRERGSNPLFRYRYYGSLHAVEHLELEYKLQQHQGSVKALNFNRKGSLLASGADDLAVVIWDWAIGKKYRTFDSGHRSDVFQTKWLPFDEEYLMATCANDGQVRLLDVRHGISRKIASHHVSTHKLAVHQDTPHIIISVGEDAKVLSIDIREEKPSELLVVKNGCSKMQLHSVQSNPLNSNEFCIGGESPKIRIYDRRKVSRPLYRLCPHNLIGNEHALVSCAVYNYNGTEVLASYNYDDIYLFDTVMPQTGDFARAYRGHSNNDDMKDVTFFGPKSEFVISGSDCGNIFIWDKNTEAIVNLIVGSDRGDIHCLEPHPHIPVLASSGRDFDVKIWVPSRKQGTTMKDLENCVKTNTLKRAQNIINNSGQYFGRRMRNIIARRRARERNREVSDNADDSSDDNYSSDDSDSQSED